MDSWYIQRLDASFRQETSEKGSIEMENQYKALSFVSAAIIAQELLKVSKAGIPAESPESYQHKVTKSGFINRVACVHDALTTCGGPTEAAAAKLIHSHQYYTDMSVTTAVEVMATTVNRLKAGENLLDPADYGDFEFAPYVPHDADEVDDDIPDDEEEFEESDPESE